MDVASEEPMQLEADIQGGSLTDNDVSPSSGARSDGVARAEATAQRGADTHIQLG